MSASRYEAATQELLRQNPEVAEHIVTNRFKKEKMTMVGAIGFAVFMGATLANIVHFHLGLRRELVITLEKSE